MEPQHAALAAYLRTLFSTATQAVYAERTMPPKPAWPRIRSCAAEAEPTSATADEETSAHAAAMDKVRSRSAHVRSAERIRTSCTALLAHSSPKSRAAGIGGRPAPALCRPSACRHAQALWAEEAQTAADIGAFDQFFVRTRPPSAASSALGSRPHALGSTDLCSACNAQPVAAWLRVS